MAVFWMIVTVLCFLGWALLCRLFPYIGKLAEGLARDVRENIRAEEPGNKQENKGEVK